MDINDLENQLFDKWKTERHYKFFIKDGVFNPTKWEKESIKITFVLKEANWQGDDADLRTWLMRQSSPTYWKTWNNIARWTKAIIEKGDYPYHVSKEDKTYWIGRISFLNLKKVGGGSVADNDAIRSYATNDCKYILGQLNMYKPDIIICCGRGNGKNADLLYEAILPKEALSDWKATSNGFNYFYAQFSNKVNKTPVVSYYHPQRIAGHDLFKKWYDDIKIIANELIDK